jgi:hypothetical protein
MAEVETLQPIDALHEGSVENLVLSRRSKELPYMGTSTEITAANIEKMIEQLYESMVWVNWNARKISAFEGLANLQAQDRVLNEKVQLLKPGFMKIAQQVSLVIAEAAAAGFGLSDAYKLYAGAAKVAGYGFQGFEKLSDSSLQSKNAGLDGQSSMQHTQYQNVNQQAQKFEQQVEKMKQLMDELQRRIHDLARSATNSQG